MTAEIKILAAQINPLVGGIEYNLKKVIEIIKNHQKEYDIIVFPELTITGYIPQDLLLRNELHERVEAALKEIQKTVEANCHVIVGHPSKVADKLYNSLTIFNNFKIYSIYNKQCLPNYAVFDEKRYFQEGKPSICTLTVNDTTFGLVICEDLWAPEPVSLLLKNNIKNIIAINSSPYHYAKFTKRKTMLEEHTAKGCAILYVNQCGGQDDIVFDGQSMAISSKKEITFKANAFKEELNEVIFADNKFSGKITETLSTEALKYEALKSGLHDYVTKNNFSGVLLGVSGGMDSALTLAIAVDALGSENVHGVILPSRYNAPESYEDAVKQLEALNVGYSEFSIEPIYKEVLNTLNSKLEITKGTTSQNIQARTRMLLLMALSNESGKLLLNTSNKSEIAVGYSTLYGDLAGAYAVLKDVYKTDVYKLADYRNKLAKNPVIPQRVIEKEPSAELAYDQKDTDALPPYEITDKILQFYIEDNLAPQDIINTGFSKEDVKLVLNRIKQNEYKRFQAPPGTKISPKAFGKDWRYPLTSGFQLKE